MFASAFDSDPATGDVMVVLMKEQAGAAADKLRYKPDWQAVFMLPPDVVRGARLQGMFELVWDDGWTTNLTKEEMVGLSKKADEAVQAWLASEGLSQVRAKEQRVAAARKAGCERVQGLYEGQIVVLSDGSVGEVRGLEWSRHVGSEVGILPYELVRMQSRSSSEWCLRHSSVIK